MRWSASLRVPEESRALRQNSASVLACPLSHASAMPSVISPSTALPQASAYRDSPARASRSSAASRTERVIGPGASWLPLIGTMPPVGRRPTVGLSPTQPLRELGHVIEPSVSVPIARGARPPATAAPDPDEEPPALRSSAQGLLVSPPTADQPLVECVERMLAHSERFVAPRTTSPAPRRRATSGASRMTARPARASDPAVPGRPTASMLSLTSTGTPCSGPRRCPAARSSSSRVACSRASGASARTARSRVSPGPSIASMRSRSVCTSSTEVTLPAPRSCAISAAVAEARWAEAG